MWFNETAAMAGFRQVVLCLLLLTLSKTIQGSESEAKEGKEEELVESESKDGKLEIIKRIKKVNEDGSYTIGYEADDGSFKIESRDVLGNIKGTYGFLDEEGQIKRVSYSTSNSSEIITKPEPTSVVQRIPNKNKATSTRKPGTTPTTPTTTSSTVIQSIARRRTTGVTSTTTQKPNYNDVINVSARVITRPPQQVTYTSAPPRVLLQGRPSISSTPATQTHTIKSEGQLVRPEVVTVKPTELPIFRRIDFKNLEDDKPVNEDSEIDSKGNILRRQLPQENTQNYNLQEQIYSLRQSLGQDATDVYSGSVTTGTPRPLFTTTKPNTVMVPSTTPPPESVPRPTVRYPLNYQRNIPQSLERNIPEYTQETSTVQSVGVRSTPGPIPVVQIPANRVENQEPLVAIRHPFQRATVLVPLSQFHGRVIPVDNMREISEVQNQYDPNQDQYFKETTRPNIVEIEQQKAVVRRLPPPPLRPIPVQVDENGYIRDVHRQNSSPYPVPVPITPAPKYVDDDVDNDVDNIQPPVSTRDFQKLLQELIIRQSRLEKISALSKQADILMQQQQRYRPAYQNSQPYFVQKEPVSRPNTPVQFIHQRPDQDPQQRIHPRQFFELTTDQQQIAVRSQPQSLYQEQYDAQAYRPNRRVARLLPARSQNQQDEEQYLPSEVREMLLLRMLQLAINPALKLDDDHFEIPTETSQFKRMPVRNVEILGEEPEPVKRRIEKSKRYRNSQKDYE